MKPYTIFAHEKNKRMHQHFIIFKPYGYLSQFIYEQKRKSKKLLLGELYNFPEGTMAIGRLDEDSEGLLLLTTDGKLSEQIRSRKVEKEYYAQVDGEITDEAIFLLERGIEIGVKGVKYRTLPCDVKKMHHIPTLPSRGKNIRDSRHGPTSWISITISEGKFRQIRKMTAAVGYPTLRLIRIRIGSIFIDDLAPGGVRQVDHLL